MPAADDLSREATPLDHERRAMCRALLELVQEGAYEEALAIADALIPIYDVELYAQCNALWLAQNDNTGLPFDEQRARRYLAATLGRAPLNPEMHLNAAGVFIELGEPEAAMRQLLLAKQRDVDLAPHLDAPLLAELKAHPRWTELVGGLTGAVEEVSWMEVVEDCFERGHLNDAVPAVLGRWRSTHSTRLADLLDAIAQATGERSGYCATRIEEAIRTKPEDLVSTLDRGTQWRVEQTDTHEAWLLYDLDDPRFSSALIPLLIANPKQPNKKLVEQGWRALMAHVAAARDRRLLAPLQALSGCVDAMNPGVIGETLRETFNQAVRRIEAAALPATLSAAEEAALTRLEAIIPRALDPFRVEVELPAAAAAPERGDGLLALWRKTRSPRVAELLILRELRSPSLQLEREVRALNPQIDLWAYEDESVRGEAAAQLIWERRHEGADPLVTEHLIQLLSDPPFIYPRADNGVENFWVELLETLKSFEDVRALEPLRAFERGIHALCNEADDVAEEEMYSSRPLGGFLQQQTQAVIGQLEAVGVEELDAEDRATVAALEAEYERERRTRDRKLAAEADWGSRERALLRAVHDDVDSDAARLAYAAHLEQRGDPYGEFIRLQVAEQNPQRQRQLLDAHEGRFLGPLANVTASARFERGFVTACEIDKFKLDRADTAELPLQTIRRLQLDASDWQRYDEASDELVANESLVGFVCHPGFRSLRRLDGVTAAALQSLVDRGPPDVETLTFDDSYAEVDWQATLAALHQIAGLRRVRASIYAPDDFEAARPLLQGELPAQVQAIELEVEARDRITNWAEIYDAWSTTRFSDFVVRSPGAEVRFVRDGQRVSLRAVQRGDEVKPILGVILRLPAASIQRFEHAVANGVAGPDAVQLEQLRCALGRYTDLDVSLPPAAEGEARDVEADLLEGRPSVEQLCRQAPEDGFAIEALGYLRAEEGLDVLVEIIRTQDHRRRQEAAFQALGQIASTRSVAPLTEIVREAFGQLDRFDFKRFEGLAALGRVGAEESLALFRETLRVGHAQDARAAAAALALHGALADVELLELAIDRVKGAREEARFLIPLFTLDLGRVDPAGARRVVASLGDRRQSALREPLVRCLIRLAERLPAQQTEVRAIFREGLQRQIRAWKVCGLEDQIDRFSPARADWIALVERLAAAWEIDSAL